MTYADEISRDTERFDPRIERYSDGDICFHWDGPYKRITRIADLCGLDEDMFGFWKGEIILEMPKEVAEGPHPYANFRE
jgi:hypothetical protein